MNNFDITSILSTYVPCIRGTHRKHFPTFQRTNQWLWLCTLVSSERSCSNSLETVAEFHLGSYAHSLSLWSLPMISRGYFQLRVLGVINLATNLSDQSLLEQNIV